MCCMTRESLRLVKTTEADMASGNVKVFRIDVSLVLAEVLSGSTGERLERVENCSCAGIINVSK